MGCLTPADFLIVLVALPGQDDDVAGPAVLNHVADGFFPVNDFHIFSTGLGNTGLDIVDDGLGFLETGIIEVMTVRSARLPDTSPIS